MRHDHLDTLARNWTLLRLIPRHPQAISTTKVLDRLREAGFRCTRRTVERDLYDFVGRFPIQVDDGSVLVEATKEDDRQLLWWIFSFGGRVEVLEPASLRKRVLAKLRRAVGEYGGGES